ncbi:MAG: hypothetical protein QMC90_05525 [Dehalococcoidales bacterium]|nr:hypothetical protein [Dehalococcoidales bacterium]
MMEHYEKLDYEKLDEVLSQIEPHLISLAKEKRLTRPSITRWRWDEPDLMLSWEEGDLSKNIHMLIVESSRVKVECNAWKNRDLEEGKKRVRKWDHKEIGEANASDINEIKEFFKKAYEAAIEWKEEENLTREEPI